MQWVSAGIFVEESTQSHSLTSRNIINFSACATPKDSLARQTFQLSTWKWV